MSDHPTVHVALWLTHCQVLPEESYRSHLFADYTCVYIYVYSVSVIIRACLLICRHLFLLPSHISSDRSSFVTCCYSMRFSSLLELPPFAPLHTFSIESERSGMLNPLKRVTYCRISDEFPRCRCSSSLNACAID